jgi:hypothetical protein
MSSTAPQGALTTTDDVGNAAPYAKRWAAARVMTLLKSKDPAEAGNFRDAVVTAVGEGAHAVGDGPAVAAMAARITNALDA